MFSSRYETRGQHIVTQESIEGIRTLIAVVRDRSAVRLEPAVWGPLWIHCGDLRLESSRGDMESTYGYSGSQSDLDQPGGQDSGVWVWKIPAGASGQITVEADWLPKMAGGFVELIGMD